MKRTLGMLLMMVAACGLVACDDGESDDSTDTGATTSTTEADGSTDEDTSDPDTSDPGDTADGFPIGPDGPTYYEHIEPILAENCWTCHTDGSIAPFNLDTYEAASGLAGFMATVTADRQMPPWGADNSGECGDFKDAMWLDDAEIELIGQWAEAGAPEGDPANSHAEPLPPQQLETVSATLDPGIDYIPDDSSSDDYRCFIVEHGAETDKFLEGFSVHPGYAPIVHHMILYTVPDQEQWDRAIALDEADEGPGYRCFGSAKLSDSLFLAAWAPGVDTQMYPETTGVRVKGDLPLIMQVHYNLSNGSQPDRTTVDLQWTDSVQNEAFLIPIPGSDLALAPGLEEVVYQFDEPSPIPFDVRAWGIFPHMHTLGRSISLEIDPPRDGDANKECFVNVPRWDFNWQFAYFYDEPRTIPSNSQILQTCTYDTRERTDMVYWGDGTADEMCLNIAYLTF